MKAGSRHETNETLGVNHALRMAAGLTTAKATSFSACRSIQQVGDWDINDIDSRLSNDVFLFRLVPKSTLQVVVNIHCTFHRRLEMPLEKVCSNYLCRCISVLVGFQTVEYLLWLVKEQCYVTLGIAISIGNATLIAFKVVFALISQNLCSFLLPYSKVVFVLIH